MIEIKNLSKTFTNAENKVEALKNISLQINDGEIFGIIGMSGAGKSTLVRCINLLEKPSEGTVIVDGQDMLSLDATQLRKARSSIAMIFQSFNLLMQKNCLENVCFPLQLAGVKKEEAIAKARKLLETVELSGKEYSYPSQLSGGQQQRVAIARSLAADPKILLCDEATSALDPKTTQSILELIKKINKQLGITVVVITHQMSVVEQICDRVAILDKGEVVEIGDVSSVFSTPHSEAAKQLVFPESISESVPSDADQCIIRIVFNGSKASNTPMIAQLAIDEHIAANILAASTRMIGDRVYGNMLLGLPKDKDVVKRAITYLRKDGDVLVQEVNEND